MNYIKIKGFSKKEKRKKELKIKTKILSSIF